MSPAASLAAWVAPLMPHLIVLPVILPLAAAAILILSGERRRGWTVSVNLSTAIALVAIAIALVAWVDAGNDAAAVGVYLPANWDVPFGIVLAVDRLSALMLLLTAVIALGALVFSTVRWHRAGVYFHPLFQIQLMGINGAFLTADLFNLFVFFEVMLTASYGLLLHGSGRPRVRAGLHYIAVNLLASSLFLIGVAMIYGISGTLGMADIAQKLPLLAPDDRGLLYAGAAILGIAFFAKAAVWPLNFWLVPAYAAAAAPVAALFVMLTKVGFYAILRLWTLFLAPQPDEVARFGADALIIGGLVTLAAASVGMLVSRNIQRLAGFAAVVSSGTLIAVIGFGDARLTGGALYYLVGSTIGVSALFLLSELIERSREVGAGAVADDGEEPAPFSLTGLQTVQGVNLDEDEEVLIGQPVPAALAMLGLAFIFCVLLIAGLPPLSGFLAKFAMLTLLLDAFANQVMPDGTSMPALGWWAMAALIASSLVAMLVMARVGVRYFWAPQGRAAPRLTVVECLPLAGLMAAAVAITLGAGGMLRYTTAAAQALIEPSAYLEAISGAQPEPGPTRASRNVVEAPAR